MNWKKDINWKKFWRWEFGCFLVILMLYAGSPNLFPENIYVIIIVPILFGLMMIMKACYQSFEQKYRK